MRRFLTVVLVRTAVLVPGAALISGLAGLPGSLPAAAAPITLLSSGSATGPDARDGLGGADNDWTSPANTSLDGVSLLAQVGGNVSSAEFSYSETALTASLGIATSLTRQGTLGARTDFNLGTGTTANSLRFTADTDATYAIGGTLTGSGGDGGQLSILARLWDITAGNALLFFQNSDSYRETPGDLEIGVFGGDLLGASSGSVTGALIAGHEYSLNMRYRNESVGLDGGGIDGGYAATGDFTFSVTADVPEAPAGPLFALAALAFAALRTRKRF